MKTSLSEVVHYTLETNEGDLRMNDFLGKHLEIKSGGEMFCLSCGKRIQKTFAQGYCYPCFISSPQTEDCVLHPELCRAHEGISRDMEYAQAHCLQNHFVYLALTSEVKVGITRSSQIPTRWIDQGAWKAIRLARTPNRFTAGMMEVALKKHLTDKTNWQRMLKNENSDMDLAEKKNRISELVSSEYQQYLLSSNEITEITYPVLEYPKKITSTNLDKSQVISGTLTGIKGQYLIFNNETVINIRRHGGYKIEIKGE